MKPYGKTTMDNDGDHGIIFLIMCADLARQFEFVQQQWINYGLDANAGNSIVRWIHDAGRALVGPFKNVFSFHSAKTAMLVNWAVQSAAQ